MLPTRAALAACLKMRGIWETRFQLDVRQQDWAEGWLDGRRWGGGGGAAVAAMERAAE
jgi:hypothetical protein